MSLGQRISKLRKDKGYSQEYVAERLDVSRQAVSKWETDAGAPDTYNLIALAELLGVSVEYIATGKNEEHVEVAPQKADITSRKIIGFVLLGIGLLSLVLGILLSETLIVLALYLILGSILCLTLQKSFWLIATWIFWAFTFVFFHGLTTQNFFCIFHPSFYTGGLSIWMIATYIFWIWLIAAISVTVATIVKKRNIKNNRQ